MQKLRDIEGFSTMLPNYDLLAVSWMPYGKVCSFGEALACIQMTAGVLIWIAASVAIVIRTIGAVSVIKAVYFDWRELKCACVGGSRNVPVCFADRKPDDAGYGRLDAGADGCMNCDIEEGLTKKYKTFQRWSD